LIGHRESRPRKRPVRWRAIRVDGGELPDLQTLGDEICGWPNDLARTMAFTPETDWGLGPYFCRRGWIVPSIPMRGT
jgi:hypothetical protein